MYFCRSASHMPVFTETRISVNDVLNDVEMIIYFLILDPVRLTFRPSFEY